MDFDDFDELVMNAVYANIGERALSAHPPVLLLRHPPGGEDLEQRGRLGRAPEALRVPADEAPGRGAERPAGVRPTGAAS